MNKNMLLSTEWNYLTYKWSLSLLHRKCEPQLQSRGNCNKMVLKKYIYLN